MRDIFLILLASAIAEAAKQADSNSISEDLTKRNCDILGGTGLECY